MRFLKSLSAEFWLTVIAVMLWAFMAWHLYTLDLLKPHYDEYTHIVSARLMTQSMTPGMSQLGFWAPLSHVVLLPFFAIPFLQQTGLAASFAMLPSLLVCVAMLYRLALSLTGNRLIAATTSLAFSANPYVLFFSVTPMAEMLMIASLVCTAYFFHRWTIESKIRHLVYCGIAISCACLSRFEAFSMVPVATIAVLGVLLLKRYEWAKLQASLLVFVLPACAGIAFIMCYSLAYSGQILAYGSYSLNPTPAVGSDVQLFGQGASAEWFTALTLWYAATYMVSMPLLAVGSVAAALAVLLTRQKVIVALLFSITLAPVAFVYFTIYFDLLGMSVPELYGDGAYNNVRYLVSVVVPLLLGVALVWAACLRACPWRFPRAVISTAFIAFLGITVGVHMYAQAIGKSAELGVRFEPLFVETVRGFQREHISAIVRDHYDYGKILTLRYANDPFLEESGLPLSAFIIESNYLYFDQVVREPWLFARFVAFPPGRWLFPEFDRLEKSESFQRYYVKIDIPDAVIPESITGKEREYFEENKQTLIFYKLNERALREAIDEFGYDPLSIPSLNPAITTWRPEQVYIDMRGARRY